MEISRLGELRLAQVAVGPNAPNAGPVFPNNETPIDRIDSTSRDGSNNEKISKELADINHILDAHTSHKEETTSRPKRRSTPHRSSRDSHPDGGLISEGE